MTPDIAIGLGRQALMIVVTLAAPVLGAGLVVGVTIAVIQAITSIQEQTMSLIPKMAAVGGMVFVLLPWFIRVLVAYTQSLFQYMVKLASQ